MAIRAKFQIEPLTPNCGSIVQGVHVNDLTDGELELVKAEVSNRCVIVIPRQFVNPADQLRFAGRLGEVMLPGHTPTIEGAPGVMQLHNNFLQAAPENHTNNWHADATHMARPPSFTMLSCEQPAPLGGDTMWSNQYLAYEALSQTMKAIIRGRRLGFVVAAYYRQFRSPDDPIETYHPLVRVHADTRRKSIFISDRRLISKIEGMTEEESKPITDFLHRHSYTPEFVYRHRWSKGDLVIWDNRCSMHYAVRDYDPTCTRTMNRLMIAGEAPISDAEVPA